ncbi:MAG: HAMP domain-containing sensor histidine kinase [bacterium]
MKRPRDTTRAQLLLFVLLTLFLIVQVSWWIVFQIRSGERFASLQQDLWLRQLSTAQLWSGVHASEPGSLKRWLDSAFPDLTVTDDGRIVISPAAERRLQSETRRAVRMFMYEGVFFSAVLILGTFFMYWTLRRELTFERRQTSFLSAISHELKTPITALRLYSETLQQRKLPREQEVEILGSMGQNLDRLQSLIDRLLQARAMITSRPANKREVIHAADEIREAVRHVRESVGDLYGIDLTLELDETLRLFMDAEHCRIVVSNLVENAVKYSPKGGVVRISCVRHGRRARLTVEDRGMGFNRRERQRIFDRFYRAESEDTRRTSGSGLGLYLVREIVRSYGGSVSAKSPGEGLGATFVVTLPIA